MRMIAGLMMAGGLVAACAQPPAPRPDEPKQCDAAAAQSMDLPVVHYDEAGFRYALNADAMATEKLAEGIRAFAADAIKLEHLMLAA